MSRPTLRASAVAAVLLGAAAPQAGATDLARCLPHHRHHVAVRRAPPEVVYGRHIPRVPAIAYNYEDSGRYDGTDVPPRYARHLGYGQPASWLDGYGTRPVVYGAYGSYNVYGGSSQVMPFGIPPAGGLAVYAPGAYGPGPTIIRIPD